MDHYRKLPTGHPAVILMTPVRGGLTTTAYTAGVLNSFGVYGAWAPLTGQSDIYVARNILVNEFLRQPQFDAMVFIDSDIGFERPDLERLLSHKEHIVAGAYPGRSHVIENLCKDYDGSRPSIEKLRERDLYPVRLAPTGFMKIDRCVLEKVGSACKSYGAGKHRHFFTSEIIDDELASEDFSFCTKVNEAGFQIYMDGRLDLNHDGHTFPRWKK